MSRIRTNLITNRMANGAPTVSNGLVITGVTTSTTFSGSGASLTNLPAANLTGTLPAISGANLTNLPAATTITVADESTDTTCNPLFVTTTSGNLAPKTGTNLTFNSASGNLRTGSLFLGTATNESKTQDGLIMERNSGDGLAHITAGRSGGNYSGFEFYVAGASGVTKRHLIDYQSNFRWYGADGTTERMRLNNSGRLGINEGSPNATLHIKSADAANNRLELVHQNDAANEQNQITFKNNTTQTAYIVSGKDSSNNNIGLSFATGNTVRMNIDASGNIRKFYNPLFVAQKSAVISGTGPVVFNTVIENVGSHYNSSNGRFTAPIAGYYWFCCKINAYRRLDFHFRRNGSNSGNANREIGQFNTSNEDGWYSHNLVRIFELSANDWMEVNVTNLHQNSDPGEWLTFQGYLLQ